MKCIIRDGNGRILAEYFTMGGDKGIEFHTPPDAALQVGTLVHPAGHIIQPHSHRPIHRTTVGNQEVLLIQNGRLGVNIYDDSKKLITTVILLAGEFIVFYAGGHGFKALTDVSVFEVKQGPYVGEADKERF